METHWNVAVVLHTYTVATVKDKCFYIRRETPAPVCCSCAWMRRESARGKSACHPVQTLELFIRALLDNKHRLTNRLLWVFEIYVSWNTMGHIFVTDAETLFWRKVRVYTD